MVVDLRAECLVLAIIVGYVFFQYASFAHSSPPRSPTAAAKMAADMPSFGAQQCSNIQSSFGGKMGMVWRCLFAELFGCS